MLYTQFKKNHRDVNLDKLLDSNKIIKFYVLYSFSNG